MRENKKSRVQNKYHLFLKSLFLTLWAIAFMFIGYFGAKFLFCTP